MPSPLLVFAVTAMTYLSPGRDHLALAQAITSEVEAGSPLFDRDEDKTKTLSTAIAVAFREGSLLTDVVGDMRGGQPTSFCTYQINLPGGSRTANGWTGIDLRDDVRKCSSVGLKMLRDSVRVCPRAPIAHYAVGGAGACTNARAVRISNDRMALGYRVRAATLRVLTEIAEVPSTSFFSPIDATSTHAKGLHAGSFRTVGG